MSRELGYEVWVLVAQIGVVLMAITIIILEMIHIGQGNKNHVARAMILTFWMIHTIIYYGFVFLNQLHIIVIKDAIVFFTSWSATLRDRKSTRLNSSHQKISY